MSVANLPAVSGVIFAGGQGSRMGGIDKGLVPFHGVAMIAHVIERFAPQVTSLVINANRSIPDYASFGYPVVSDELTGFAGPLAGLAAAMQHFAATGAASAEQWIVSTPCDSPFVPRDFVPMLLRRAQVENAEIAVCRTPSGAQPVCALYRLDVLPSLQSFLASGRRKIDVWTAQHHTVHVDFEDEKAFSNLNTVADLQAF